MELDYRELKAITAAQEILKARRQYGKGIPVWAVMPVAVMPLIVDQHQSRHFSILMITCVFGWILLFGIAQMLRDRRYFKQLSALLDVARRAMDSDPANRQKLNELQALETRG